MVTDDCGRGSNTSLWDVWVLRHGGTLVCFLLFNRAKVLLIMVHLLQRQILSSTERKVTDNADELCADDDEPTAEVETAASDGSRSIESYQEQVQT